MSVDNPKDRMRKHRQNKNVKYKPQKFKSKSADSMPSPAVTKSVRNPPQNILETNWDRYDREEENDHALTDSTNFKLLAEAVISQGSHFQFKSDRNSEYTFDFENSVPDTDNLFKLNLDILDKSLSTIAFSRRCNIDEKYFTDNHKKIMAATAMDNLKSYKTLYDDKFKVAHKLNDLKELRKVNIIEDHLDECEDEIVTQAEQQLNISDLSSDLMDSTNADVSLDSSSPNAEENLEEWLEDLLAS